MQVQSQFDNSERFAMAKYKELQELIAGLVRQIDPLTDSAVWQAHAGSLMMGEFENSEMREDGTAWGDQPVRTAITIAQMNMRATVEYASAIAELIDPPRVAVPLEALTRSALEAASASWWITEPGIGARRRVIRMLLLRYNSARELERAVNAVGVDPEIVGGATIGSVDRYRAGLGISPFRRNGENCEGESRISYTRRVKELTTAWGYQGSYEIYSSVAHAEIAGLRRMYTVVRAPTNNIPPILIARPNYEAAYHAARGALIAMICPFHRIAEIFGWTSPTGANQFLELIMQFDREIHRLKP